MDEISTFGYVDVDLDIIVKKRKSDTTTSSKGLIEGKDKGYESGQAAKTREEPAPGAPKVEHVSINVKEEGHLSLMKEKLTLYKDDYVKPYWDIISKVPEKLIKVNEEAYTPRIVAIGPRNHGK